MGKKRERQAARGKMRREGKEQQGKRRKNNRPRGAWGERGRVADPEPENCHRIWILSVLWLCKVV